MSSESDNDSEESSTESSDKEEEMRCSGKKTNRKSSNKNPASSNSKKSRTLQGKVDGYQSNDLNAQLLALEPESDHDSDSDSTRKIKRLAQQEHHARLTLLKYQQGFLKHKPPFTYNGEVNMSTFKKWVHEVHAWRDRAKLSTPQSLSMIGKYLGNNKYRFYERDILDLKKRYSLTKLFEQLFDYIFPTNFRMLQ
ncbi:uncharacterized protein EDB93DRAFT_1109313 [Suillus bovinus]|uniref:uncharacterized protein n=1 Tax=Suillus bovinus TaxID=48563 RepID=UPI001B860496|nr:uncharacterized protein EDB93DRAFT_1109313 [Suillus bovinus]KAG2127297.1 hypothetical protein EDB93DRAFT_1109313 [Suillus bovinus]